MVPRGVNSNLPPSHKNWSPPSMACPPLSDDFKSLKLFAPPSPINITTMVRHHKQFPSNLQQASPQVRLTPHVSIGTPMNNF